MKVQKKLGMIPAVLPEKMTIAIHWTIDDRNEIIFDFDQMTNEFEDKTKKLIAILGKAVSLQQSDNAGELVTLRDTARKQMEN